MNWVSEMSELFDDTNHPVSFESPLGSKLVVQSMSGDEALGGLFNYSLELLSQDFELHFDQIVGQQVTVALELPDGKRHFNAFITEFRYLGHTDRYARYQATLRPWLWFLTRTSDCKIYQEMKVPDIIKEVFRDNGMSHFEDRLRGDYREWEYCVQYRETDFNFVSRLMEQEGIYYYFEHFEDKHMLILTDDMGTHKPFPKFETIPYCPPTGQMSVQEEDHLQHWGVTQSIQPEQYAIQDFDFKKPRVNMLSRSHLPGNHDYPIGNPEIFDYPGEYVEPDDGFQYAEIRLEELRGQFEKVKAGGPCRGISAGCLFTLEDYPREDQNKEYLVLSVSHQINDTGYISSGGGSSEELYRCQVFAMDSLIPYRQARSTPKPIVQGPQTAMVVGPSGEEIYTDKFGRVKVQFHWDRYGKEDENSSCWIRVSQLWAGANWGAMHIPRIGQEVIVSFMEGDPDKPVITGRVYNAECMPPYTLEQSKTQSGIKSRSSKGGSPNNFNEIRMEDKKGSEELYIQAEKNENILVKNSKTENVGNNETVTIGNNRTETVMMDETLTVNNNRTRNVMKNETVTVAMTRVHTVGINEAITIGAAQEVTIGAAQMITVGAVQSTEVGASQSVTVSGSQSVTAGGSRSLSVGKDYSINVGKDRNANIGAKDSLTVGKDWVVEAGDSITIKCGSSQLVMKKNGNILLKGKNIKFKASGKMDLKASGTIKLKGSSIKEN